MTMNLVQFYSFSELVIAIIIVWLAFAILRRFIRRYTYNLPPGPRGLPILGHLAIFECWALFEHKDKYGDISHLNILSSDVIVLNSIESIRYALTSSETADIFSRRPKSSQTSPSNFNIVFGSPSPEWKQLKRTLHALLKQHGEGIVELEGIVAGELKHLTDLLDKNTNRKMDMGEFIQAFTANVIVTLLIGERYDYRNDLIAKVGRYVELATKLGDPFVEAVLRVLPIIRFLPVWLGKTIKDRVRIRNELFNDLLYRYKRISDDDLQVRRGIVFDLIRLQRRENWMTDSKIRGVIMNIIGAGVATTSTSLYAFFLIILRHPEVQRQIQEEIDECIGKCKSPTMDDRNNMPYTQAVILELLRYSSVVPLSAPHSCPIDTVMFGYTIPAESVVLPNLFRVHHDEKNWENPWEFNPRRFIDDAGQLIPASHPIRRNLIPFGIGKRICVGEVFAKTRIFLFIVYLLQRFTFLSADNVPPSCDPRNYSSDLTIHPAPYKLIIKPRLPS